MLALVVIAKFASDSVIPPTPEAIILIETSSFPILAREVFIASAVPATSVLIIRFKNFIEAWPIDSNISPMLSSFCLICFFSFCLLSLKSITSLAAFSFLTTWKELPAFGAVSRPSTSTADDGPACLIFSPDEFVIAFTFPIDISLITTSPTFKQPF